MACALSRFGIFLRSVDSTLLFFLVVFTKTIMRTKRKDVFMPYELLSDRALLDLAFTASLMEDKSEYEEIMKVLDERIHPQKEDDSWF